MNELDRLIKKRSAFKSFSVDVSGGISHAYIVVCEDGAVRGRLLELMAERIFCPSACGECKICSAIEEGNYLDVKFLDGKEMNVASVSELTENAQMRPVVGDRKVYLINNADKLNPQSQNKLLKTYEEPPAFVTVILACASENGLLRTIRSRAKRLSFDALTSAEIIKLLTDDGAEREQAEVAAAIGNGSLEKAEKFLNSDSFVEIYNGCFELLGTLESSAKIPEYVLGDLFTKENIATSFDVLEIIFADVMSICSGSGLPLLNDGRQYDVGKIAEKYGTQAAAAALAAINEGRKMLNSNLSSISCAERALFKILEARHKWQ